MLTFSQRRKVMKLEQELGSGRDEDCESVPPRRDTQRTNGGYQGPSVGPLEVHEDKDGYLNYTVH
jgi:hypothetical protein